MSKTYKIILEIDTDEKPNVEELLRGAWIYDLMFAGSIISEKIEELKE